MWTQPNRNSIINTDSKQVVSGEEWGGGKKNIGERNSEVQNSIAK